MDNRDTSVVEERRGVGEVSNLLSFLTADWQSEYTVESV